MRSSRLILAGTILAAGTLTASAASIDKSIEVNASPEKVWSMIGKFCSIKDWHPAIGQCTESDGVRTLVTKDGKATFVEKQTASDDKTMMYSYMIEKSPLPITDYKSTIQGDAGRQGHVEGRMVQHLYARFRQGRRSAGCARRHLPGWPRQHQEDGRHVSHVAFAAILTAALVVCLWAPARAEVAAPCRPGSTTMARVDLFFGAGRVSRGAWARFLATVVTPRFPDGLTSLVAAGQWRGPHGLARENAHVLVVFYRPDATSDARIEAIRHLYEKQFLQTSVLRADSVACVSF